MKGAPQFLLFLITYRTRNKQTNKEINKQTNKQDEQILKLGDTIVCSTIKLIVKTTKPRVTTTTTTTT